MHKKGGISTENLIKIIVVSVLLFLILAYMFWPWVKGIFAIFG